MNIKSLITSFAVVAATSTAALAAPTYTFGASASVSVGSPAPVVVRDHRIVDDGCEDPALVTPVTYRQPQLDATWYRPAPQPIFIRNTQLFPHSSQYIGPVGTMGRSNLMIALSQPTRIDNGREDFLIRQGGFDTVMLRGNLGSTFVQKVTIEFMDDSAQVINVNRALGASQSITLDVRGQNRQVKRIFVYGTSGSRSAYQLFAS